MAVFLPGGGILGASFRHNGGQKQGCGKAEHGAGWNYDGHGTSLQAEGGVNH
jgi:hypothetical protein